MTTKFAADGATWQTTEKDLRTVQWPLIDSDPHVNRVISYMRPSDYLCWAGMSLFAPSWIFWEERVKPTGRYGQPMSGSFLRRFVGLTAVGGFAGGFLWAYARSANRFTGNRENYREYKRDYNEMSARVKNGESLYGNSTVPESQLRIAHYNSMNSHLFLFAIPWFNFVHHPFHGRDVEEYKRPFKYPDLQAIRNSEVAALKRAALKATEDVDKLEKGESSDE